MSENYAGIGHCILGYAAEPEKPAEPTKPGTTPATGDMENVAVLVSLCLAAMVGCCAVTGMIRKKH